MNNRKYLPVILFFLSCISVYAQDDMMKIMQGADSTSGRVPVIATFKTTRIIDMHTVETVGPRTLDFRISHRFGAFNTGAYNGYGIDGGADIRLGLEYSWDGRLMAGIGRTSFEKMTDGFLKYRLLRQTQDNHMPLSVTLFAGMYYTNLRDPNRAANGYDKYALTTSRLSYCYEMIIGRKFSRNFSFQLAPFLVHYNLVDLASDNNDVYGVQAGLRWKITRSFAITSEYAYRINDYSTQKYYDSFGVGFEIETGGHVFQIHITNSFGLTENQTLAHTDTKWDNAGVRLGFNISRVFTVGGKKKSGKGW